MNSNEVVITSAKRTAVGSLGKSLKNVQSFELGSSVIKELLLKSKINKEEIDEVILGQVLTAGLGQNPAHRTSTVTDRETRHVAKLDT